MTDQRGSRGFYTDAVLKLMRAGDYRLTMTGKREISPHYLRLSFDAGGMLAEHSLHPTMWIRMWFADGNRLHQHGYTLVDPDPEADAVDIEFALHDGLAARWARDAQPGDTIGATVLGSKFAIPQPSPAGYVIVGDAAALRSIGRVRCERPFRLGGLRQPHHALGNKSVAKRLRPTAEIPCREGLLDGRTLHGMTSRLLGRHHDGDDELLDHRPFVGRVAAREDQQRGDHAH
jgi:hypothetical protein